MNGREMKQTPSLVIPDALSAAMSYMSGTVVSVQPSCCLL